MVLGEGRSLTGFVWLKPFCMVELVLSLNSFCMVPLFWGCSTGVTLVLRWYVAVFRWCSVYQLRIIHMSWVALREITGVFAKNVVKKREKLIVCVAVM